MRYFSTLFGKELYMSASEVRTSLAGRQHN